MRSSVQNVAPAPIAALSASTNVTAINLSGGATNLIITQVGSGGAIVLANLTDSGAENLDVFAAGDLTLNGAVLNGGGSHRFTVDVDGDNASGETLLVTAAMTLGNARFQVDILGAGLGLGDYMDVNADITASGTLDIGNFGLGVDLAADVDLSAGGPLWAPSINLSGGDGTTNRIDGHGDAGRHDHDADAASFRIGGGGRTMRLRTSSGSITIVGQEGP